MKKKAGIISAFFIMSFLVSAFVGCGSIFYESRELEKATVGVYYTQSIDTAESGEGENVTYKLKEGSTLPAGLSMEGGSITGTPEKAVENHNFTVIAATESAEAEATYTITVARGKIVYEAAEAYAIVGKENSGTVAFATGGVNIQYELTDGTMPNGLTINADGSISGSYPRVLKGREVTVKASAQDCEPAEAKIKINVVNPFLTYSGKTLADAKQGAAYAASVAYIEESGVIAKYRLKEGSSLPEGLTLSAEGVISGVPTTVKRAEPFTVVAKASGYSDAEAEFLIDVILNNKNDKAGQIAGFKGATLDNAYQEEYYLNQAGVARGVVALNNNNVTYALAEGQEENFPEGLTLYPNGAIFGTPKTIQTVIFKVTASAEGCAPVTADFAMVVKGSKIKYETAINADIATRGEQYSFSVASANAGDGVAITYSADQEALTAVGLSINERGLITGTPIKSLKSMNFKVTASAGEDYTDAECTVYLHIQEPLTAATVFEAEYTNLTGKQGTGYSGSPGEEDLITADSTASNGRFINYLHNDKVSIDFEIYADENTSAELTLSLGSELGNIVLNPGNFEITVNGVSVSYGSINVTGGKQVYAGFSDYGAGTINLQEGKNEIKLAVKTNTLKEGATGGPGIDCIKLRSSTTLRWHPRVFNIGD